MTTAYILDGIAAVLILGLGLIGAWRGFFKTVMKIVAVIAALVIASQFATPLSEMSYDILFAGDIKRELQIEMVNFRGDAEDAVSELMDAMPKKARKMLEKYGLVTADDYLKKADVTDAADGKAVTEQVEESVVRPVAVKTMTGACFLALFVISLIVLLLLVALLNRIMLLPVLNAVNRVFGFVVGVLEGAVCVLILANVLSLVVSSSAASKAVDPWITRETLDSTYVVHHFELKDNELVETVRDWAISTAKTKAAQEPTEKP